jgi:hypothetical protein
MKRAIILIAIAIVTAGSAFADVKIKTRQTASGQSTESTTYIKGKRQRTEMGNGMLVSIMQCDLGRDLQLAPQTRSYTISYYTDANGNPTVPVTQGVSAPATKGGIVNVTTTIRDTGERKQMFGYTARHIIQTVEMESSADACYPQNNKMEMDMWVIDAEFGLACAQSYGGRSYNNGKNGGCQDKYTQKTIGTAKSGYPVYQKMTSFDPSGKEQFSMIQEVVELSKTNLDAGLFEVPADYREVKDTSQLYTSATINSSSTDDSIRGRSTLGVAKPIQSSEPSGMSKNVISASETTTSVIGPKTEGTIRVGVIVKTGSVGEGLAAADLAKAVENTFGLTVKGTRVEIVPIEAKIVTAQANELKEKECDYAMLATVSHKKGGGGFGGFGKMFSAVAPAMGYGGIAGQVAASAVITAASMSGSMKAKDEVTLEIAVNSAANPNPVLARQFKSKAKGNGDDIISAVVQQAAQAIIDTVGK